MKRLSIFLLLLGAFASAVGAASASTFCKCTCFTESKLIPISSHRDPPPPPPSSPTPSKSPASSDQSSIAQGSSSSSVLDRRAGLGVCSQCTRAWCLSQNLPMCKGAEEKDVVTMCIQRDSVKDQIIVWGFILGTTGLMAWAAAQKVLEMRSRGQAALPFGFGSQQRSGGGGARSPGVQIPGNGSGRPGGGGDDAGRGAYRVVEEDG